MQYRHRSSLAARSRWQRGAAAAAHLGNALFGVLVSGFAAAAVSLHPELMLSSTERVRDEPLPGPGTGPQGQSSARGA